MIIFIGLALYGVYSLEQAVRAKQAKREEENRYPGPYWDNVRDAITASVLQKRLQEEFAAEMADVLTIVDPPRLDQSVEAWRDHLAELEETPPHARDFLLQEAIARAREVIREKEEGELPY